MPCSSLFPLVFGFNSWLFGCLLWPRLNPFFCLCFGHARTWRLCLRMSQSCWIATSKSILSFSLFAPIFPNFTRFEIPTISRIFFHGSLGNSFGIVPRRPAQSLVKFGEDLDKIWVEKLKTRGCFCPHRIVRPPHRTVRCAPDSPAGATGQSGAGSSGQLSTEQSGP